MPGYQPVRIVPTMDTSKKEREHIYGVIKAKKGKNRDHPLFEDLKTRDHGEYAKLQKYRNLPKHLAQSRFDSLKLLGSFNDAHYLDSFMSMPRNRSTPCMSSLNEPRPRAKGVSKSPSSTMLKEKQRKTSATSSDSSITLAMLNNLRNAGSDESLYESVEMIHYLKTMELLNKQKKTRSLQKTGHPLFDHLREEQAMKAPKTKKSSPKKPQDNSVYSSTSYNSQQYNQHMISGNSPSPSSSSSGDEYDSYPSIQFAKHASRDGRHYTSRQFAMRPLPAEPIRKEEKHQQKKVKSRSEQPVSESEDDWMIPRPRFLKVAGQSRKRGVDSPLSSGTDESDSSSKSTGLR